MRQAGRVPRLLVERERAPQPRRRGGEIAGAPVDGREVDAERALERRVAAALGPGEEQKQLRAGLARAAQAERAHGCHRVEERALAGGGARRSRARRGDRLLVAAELEQELDPAQLGVEGERWVERLRPRVERERLVRRAPQRREPRAPEGRESLRARPVLQGLDGALGELQAPEHGPRARAGEREPRVRAQEIPSGVRAVPLRFFEQRQGELRRAALEQPVELLLQRVRHVFPRAGAVRERAPRLAPLRLEGCGAPRVQAREQLGPERARVLHARRKDQVVALPDGEAPLGELAHAGRPRGLLREQEVELRSGQAPAGDVQRRQRGARGSGEEVGVEADLGRCRKARLARQWTGPQAEVLLALGQEPAVRDRAPQEPVEARRGAPGHGKAQLAEGRVARRILAPQVLREEGLEALAGNGRQSVLGEGRRLAGGRRPG